MPQVEQAGPTRRYQRRGLHGEVVDTIGRRITSGAYRPGDQLLCEQLEGDLGVSQTVIREALKVLAAKGLVEPRPKRGTVVSPREVWSLLDPDLLYWQSTEEPGAAFLQDLAEVRFIIEPEGARLAAQRRSPADIEAIEAALVAMAKTGERPGGVRPNEVVEADLAFHRALLAAAHNELLSRMEPVIEAGLRVRDQLVHRGGRGADALAEHEAVAEAVRAGDAEAAALGARRLLQRAVDDTASLLERQAAPPRKRRSSGQRGKAEARPATSMSASTRPLRTERPRA